MFGEYIRQFKGTPMQKVIENSTIRIKASITFLILRILELFTCEVCIFLKKYATF